MKMQKFKFDGFERITKTKCRKLFEEGKEFYMCPCNLRPGARWNPEILIDVNSINERKGSFLNKEKTSIEVFNQLVIEFTHYNCPDRDCGLYPAFYVTPAVEVQEETSK